MIKTPNKVSATCLLLLCSSIVLHANTWTLDKAIQTALEQNPQILSIKESLKDADSKVSEAWGSAMPSVTLQTKYQKAFEQYTPSTASNPFAKSSPYFDQNNTNYSAPTAALAQDVGGLLNNLQAKDYTTSASLVVTQVLFAQGKIGTGLKIAKANEGGIKAELAATEANVRKQVAHLFYQSLFLQDANRIYDLSIEQSNQHLKNVENLFKSGMVSELDLLNAQISVEKLKSSQEKNRENLVLSMNALLNQMGLPYDNEVQIVGALEEDPIIPEFQQSYQVALQNRNDLKQLEKYQELQGHLVDLAKADYLPSLVIGGAFSKVSNTNEWNTFDWGNDAKVFIQAEWNLFNGGQTHQKVIQARTEVTKLSIQNNYVKNGIKLQIESEINQLKSAKSQLVVRKRMIELAEKNYTMASKSYEVGQITQLDMQDAELNLINSKLQYKQTLLELNNSVISLKLAMGIL